MSIAVPLVELAATIDRYGPVAFLLTTGPDARPHISHVAITVGPGAAQLVPGWGQRTLANAAEHPAVVLLWPAAEEGGHSLIVDGEVRFSGTPLAHDDGPPPVIVPTGAVLHRPAVARPIN